MASASSFRSFTPKDFRELLEWEQANPKTSATQKADFKSLCISVLSQKKEDRSDQLYKSIQEQCPMLSKVLRGMGACISDAEERIARTLIPLRSFLTSVDEYGKLLVLNKVEERNGSFWRRIVRQTIYLEKKFREAVGKDSDIGKETVSRVRNTFARYFNSMARSGWEPNKELPNPLHRAVQENCPVVAEEMIIRKADLYTLENGETPLAHAARLGHSEVVRILQKHMRGGSVENEFKESDSDNRSSSVSESKSRKEQRQLETDKTVLQPRPTGKPENGLGGNSLFYSSYKPIDWMV